MNRPMVMLAGFYAIGIAFGRYFEPDWILLSLIFAIFLSCGYFVYGRISRYEWIIALPFVAVGIFMVNLQKGAEFDKLDQEMITVKGVASDVYETDYGAQIITIDDVEIAFKGDVLEYDKKIRVTTYEPQPLHPGQSMTASGKAVKLDFKRNPGGYPESLQMRIRGIGGKLAEAQVFPGEMESSFAYFSARAADRVSTVFYETLPPHMAEIMRAMILGDRAGLPEEINTLFRNTGIAHILSISGFHISLAAMLSLKFFSYAGLRLRGRALATIAALWVYCFFTGASVSTVRACIMTTVILSGYVLHRDADLFSSLALSALIILFGQPLFLWDAGFLLSFSAVIGIGLFSPVLRRLIRSIEFRGVRLQRDIAAAISVTAAATIFTLPISAYYFYSFTTFGIFTNLLVVPGISIITGAGLMLAVFGGLFSFGVVSGVIASVVFTVLKYSIFVAEFFDSLPFSSIVTGQPKLYNIAIYYVVVVLVVLALQEDNPLVGKRAVIGISAAALLGVLINIPSFFPGNKLEIAFLDVKQGDASVLHLPGNTTFMIDGGGNMLRGIGENTGRYVVYPYLSYKGITKLDAVFLSHPDFDHAGGIIEIMGLVKVNRLFISDVRIDDDVLEMVLEAARLNKVPVTRIKSGYGATIGGVRIDCLYPSYSGATKSANSSSMVLKITHGENTFLFTGDMENNDEEKLLLSGADIKCDLLKVPHHGSRTSSSSDFVSAASPTYAVVGTGRDNHFGHPAPEVVERYEEANAKLYNTAEEGAVIISSDGGKIGISTLREEAERWSN